MGSPPSAAVEVVAKPRVLKLHKPGHVRSAGPSLPAAPVMTDDADAAAAPTPAVAVAEPEPPAVGSKERITRRRQREISEAGGQPAVLARIPRDVSPSQLLLQGSAAAPVVAVTKTCRRPRQTLRATKELVARLSRPNCSALARQRSSHPTACPCRRSCVPPPGGAASARTSSCTSSAFQSARSSTAAGRPTAARPSSRAPQCPGKKARFGTAGRTSMQRLSQRLSVRAEPAASPAPGGAVTSSRPSPRAVTFAGPELELLTLDLVPRCDDDHTAVPRASRKLLADSQHGLPRDAVVVSEGLIAALLARAADHGPLLREAAALRAENSALRELLEDTAHDLAEAQERAADLHDDYHNVVMVLEQASQEQAARDAAFLAHATSPVSSAPASFSPHDVSQATTAIVPSCPSAGDANTVVAKSKQRSLSRPRAKRSRSADGAATQDTQPPVVSRSSSAASTDGGTPDMLSHPGPGPDPAAAVGLAPRGSALLHPRLPSCGPSSPTAQRRPPPEFAAPKEAVVAKKEGPAPTEQPSARSMTPRRRDPSLQSIRDSLGGVTSSASLLKGHPSPPPRGPDKENTNTATLPATPCADRGRGRLSVQERRQRSPSVRALLTRQSQQAV